MSAMTMEVFTALRVGEQVRVGTAGSRDVQTWTRGPNGWTYIPPDLRNLAPVVLPSAMFEGYVRNGMVWSASTPMVGDFYQSLRAGRHTYLVVEVTETLVRLAHFIEGVYESHDRIAPGSLVNYRLVPMEERPEWVGPTWSVLMAMQTSDATFARVQHDLSTQVTNLQQRIADLNAALDDERTVEHTTEAQVRVHGTTSFRGTPIEQGLRTNVGVPERATADHVDVHWETTLTMQATGPVCACGRVSEPWVREQLGLADDVKVAWTVACTRH